MTSDSFVQAIKYTLDRSSPLTVVKCFRQREECAKLRMCHWKAE